MKITQDYIKSGTQRRPGSKLIKKVFIVMHDTGNPNSTAKGNVNYYKNSANETTASAHVFIDDKDIIECIPTDEKAWHVRYQMPQDNQLFGIDANDGALGIELCYFPNDKERSLKAYWNTVDYTVEKCIEWKINPRKYIVGHETLDPGRKTDPTNALKHIGKTFDEMIDDIAEKYSKLASGEVKNDTIVIDTKSEETLVVDPILEPTEPIIDTVETKKETIIEKIIKTIIKLLSYVKRI